MCEDGTGAVGCGPQEEFRACSDISIGEYFIISPNKPHFIHLMINLLIFQQFPGELDAAPPLRPIRPGTKPTKPSRITDGTKSTPATDVETFEVPVYDPSSRYLGAVVIILSTLLVVLCLLFAIYLYYYHGSRVKHFMHWNQPTHHKSPPPPMSGMSISSKPVSMVQPNYPPPAFDAPVPPPRSRTKRLSQTLDDVASFDPSTMSTYGR